jgi:hypothetical protein
MYSCSFLGPLGPQAVHRPRLLLECCSEDVLGKYISLILNLIISCFLGILIISTMQEQFLLAEGVNANFMFNNVVRTLHPGYPNTTKTSFPPNDRLVRNGHTSNARTQSQDDGWVQAPLIRHDRWGPPP